MRIFYVLEFTRVNVVGESITDRVSNPDKNREDLEFKDESEVERWLNKNKHKLHLNAEYSIKKIYKPE